MLLLLGVEEEKGDEEKMLVWYAAVHLTAMSSACANPIMYGFLNENFKQVNNNSNL